jgi:hypothetical protein
MRKMLFLLLILLVSAAWVAAQQPSGPGQTPGMPPSHNPDRPQPGAPPSGAPSTGADQSMTSGNTQVTEGCLGGSAPNFTVTDKAGTAYNLDIPKDADTAPLTAHIGQSVKVKGAVSGTSIQVEQMAGGTGSCPAGSEKPSAK